MVTDMFESKKEQVYNFIKQRKWAKTSDVIKFGSSIFSNRAEKDARDLANPKYTNPPKIRRMPLEKRKHLFPDIKEEIWEVMPWTERPIPQMGLSLQSNSKYEEGR